MADESRSQVLSVWACFIPNQAQVDMNEVHLWDFKKCILTFNEYLKEDFIGRCVLLINPRVRDGDG